MSGRSEELNENLVRLDDMLETGLLTEDEHARERAALIESVGAMPETAAPSGGDKVEPVESEEIDILRAELRATKQRLNEAEAIARAKQRDLQRIEELTAAITGLERDVEAQQQQLEEYRAELSELRSKQNQKDEQRGDIAPLQSENLTDGAILEIGDIRSRMPAYHEGRAVAYQALCAYIQKKGHSIVPKFETVGPHRYPLGLDVKLWRKEYQKHSRDPRDTTPSQRDWFDLLSDTPGWVWSIPFHQRRAYGQR